MKDRDPLPLSDPDAGAPALLRDALAGARADLPDAARFARLAESLPRGGPPSGAPPPGGGAIAPTGAPSVLSGALVGAALGVLVAGAGLFWDAQRAPTPGAPRAAPTVLAAPARPPVAAAPPPAPPVATASPASAPRPAVSAPSAAPPASAASSSAQSLPEPEPERAPPPSGATASAPPLGDPETEAHLLQRAQDALGASPAQALALTAEHAARFGGGALAQEREVVAVQALFKLGRAEAARVRAAAFLESWPRSAHRRRIEGLLGR